MNFLKRGAIALLFMLLLLAAGTYFLLSTSSGLYFLLERAAHWVPGLSIGNVSGAWQDLTLDDIRYQTSSVDLQIARLHLAQTIGCLKRGQICVENVWLQQVKIKVERNQQPTTITLDRVDTAAIWRLNRLTLRPTHIEGLAVTLPITAATAAGEPDGLPAQVSRLEANLNACRLRLPNAIRLPLAIDIQSVTGHHWRLSSDQQRVIDQVSFSAHIQRSSLSISELSLKIADAQLKLHGNILLRGNYPLSLTVAGEMNRPPLLGERLQAVLAGSLRERIKLQLNLAGPLLLQAVAEMDVSQAGLPLTLTLQSNCLQWPLTASPRWQAQALTVRIGGRLTAYTLSLKARLLGNAMPPSEVTLQGSGDLQQLRVEPLQLSMLTGSASLRGRVTWHKQWRWQGILSLQDLDIGQHWPAWPLKLAGSLEASGHLDEDRHWQIAIPVTRLRGMLNNHPLAIEGSLQRHAEGRWATPQLQASVGVNHLELKGDLTAPWQLQAVINAPKLADLLPGLGGAIKGKLALRGTPSHPQLQADVRADNFRWQQLTIAWITLRSQIDSGSQINGQINMTVDQLQQQGLKIDRLQLTARGNEQQHLLQLRVQGEPLAGTFKVSGRFARQTSNWRGELREAQLQTAVGTWQPTQPIAAYYQHLQRHFTLSAHCWHNPSATLYIPKLVSSRGDLQAKFDIQRLDLAMFQPFLSPLTQLKGRLTGHSVLRWQPGEHWPQVKLTLRGQQIKVVQSIHRQLLPVDCDAFTLNVLLGGRQALLDGSVILADKGRIQARLQIDDPQHQRCLSGDLQLKALSLQPSLLPLVLPLKGQDATKGLLNGQVRFAGTVAQPQLFGSVILTHGNLPGLLPIDNLLDGMLKLTFKGRHSQLNGQFKTTQGMLSLQGNTYWQTWRSWCSTLRVKGDPLQVNWSQAIQLQVVPDLQIEATPTQINLKGQLAIPWARINIDTLPTSAVKVSKNEVILDQPFALAAAKPTTLSITSDLSLCLGNDVQLKSFGLKSHINGQVKALFAEQKLGLYGQINLQQGSFRAYGQDLVIRKGKLLFSGPVDQLMLDIEAIRDPKKTEDNVLVGLRVTGLVDEVNATLFSEPFLPQSEALTYLLSGRKQAVGNSNNSAVAAQISLSVLQSGKLGKLGGLTGLFEQVGDVLGIRDLSFDTAVIGNNSQIVVSGTLWRDLQFKYGLGFSTLTLRFRLMPRLYLEAISGVERALDLLYQFEF